MSAQPDACAHERPSNHSGPLIYFHYVVVVCLSIALGCGELYCLLLLFYEIDTIVKYVFIDQIFLIAFKVNYSQSNFSI